MALPESRLLDLLRFDGAEGTPTLEKSRSVEPRQRCLGRSHVEEALDQRDLNDMGDSQSERRVRDDRLKAARGSCLSAAGNIGGDQRHDTNGGRTYRWENDQMTGVQK